MSVSTNRLGAQIVLYLSEYPASGRNSWTVQYAKNKLVEEEGGLYSMGFLSIIF